NYKKFKVPFKAIGKSVIENNGLGECILIKDMENDRVLGIHMVGAKVTELINEVSLFTFMNGSTEELATAVHAHPSIGEVLMELGLKSENRAIHVEKRSDKMLDYKTVGLTHEDLKEIYKWMLLGRKIDERMWLLNRAGKLPFVISCQGQEATQTGTYYALQDDDVLAPYYRDLALVTARGITAEESMLAAFAKEGDTSSGGKQMPSHFSKKDLNILTQGSRVTTQVLHAAGASLSLKMDNKKN